MIQFRWANQELRDSDESKYYEKVLQYRHWLPYLGANGDIVLDHRTWTEWETVPKEPT